MGMCLNLFHLKIFFANPSCLKCVFLPYPDPMMQGPWPAPGPEFLVRNLLHICPINIQSIQNTPTTRNKKFLLFDQSMFCCVWNRPADFLNENFLFRNLGPYTYVINVSQYCILFIYVYIYIYMEESQIHCIMEMHACRRHLYLDGLRASSCKSCQSQHKD